MLPAILIEAPVDNSMYTSFDRNSDFYNEQPVWSYTDSMPSTPYTPSHSQFDDLSSPPSESSGLEHINQHYDSQQEQSFGPSHSHALNSPAISNSPFDSPTTPECILADHVHLYNTPNDDESISHPGRPGLCVNTSLLFQPNHDGSALGSGSQEASPGLLSPHSFTHDNTNELQPQLHRRHSHTRSAGDNDFFSSGNAALSAKFGRGRGHQRVKSAPTSRHNSPYQRFDIAKNVSNIRSISPGSVYPNNELSPISPSDTTGRVASDKIRKASTDRRKYQPSCFCDECGDTFTTNFAKDRHMKSHTGERNYICSKAGCGQRFTTDSGRKRHEKSKTLHTTSS